MRSPERIDVPSVLWHDFDEKRGLSQEFDPRCLSIEFTTEGIVMDAYDGEALIGTQTVSYDQWWRKVAG